jgi:hypothetical protein
MPDTQRLHFRFCLGVATTEVPQPSVEMVFSSPHGVIPIPEDQSAWDWVERHAANIPNKPAYVCALTERTLTFADVHDQARKICAALAAEGIAEGDVRALCVSFMVILEVVR